MKRKKRKEKERKRDQVVGTQKEVNTYFLIFGVGAVISKMKMSEDKPGVWRGSSFHCCVLGHIPM